MFGIYPARILGALLLSSVLGGCQTIVSMSQSEVRVVKGFAVEVVDEQMGFFNLYAPELSTAARLAAKCPAGLITGVQTSLTKREFIIVQQYRLVTIASCQGAKALDL